MLSAESTPALAAHLAGKIQFGHDLSRILKTH